MLLSLPESQHSSPPCPSPKYTTCWYLPAMTAQKTSTGRGSHNLMFPKKTPVIQTRGCAKSSTMPKGS
ncbi:hypothetical protein B0H67DRAFT_591383 [Lasiosphaeris hirsuta]|uniref:Uncharacterized protein n=1 Tax=Lasiosphaeris hirsuta TaxID=260670 RepID=A0AA40DIH0_9PEZI|nr:hypothetical protein B0H67DRAFT_591383 [Lasiosphaeris hirsuta]